MWVEIQDKKYNTSSNESIDLTLNVVQTLVKKNFNYIFKKVLISYIVFIEISRQKKIY